MEVSTISNYELGNDELMHYGVLGMKWGVHRSLSKQKQNARLEKKALHYDTKSAKAERKSLKSNRSAPPMYVSRSKSEAVKLNNYNAKKVEYKYKSKKLAEKAFKTSDPDKRLKLERKSQKLGYKAAKTKLKMTKYLGGDVGSKSLNYVIKSDAFAAKAAKARMRIANNKSYIAATKRKISKITPEDISGAYSFVNELLKSA